MSNNQSFDRYQRQLALPDINMADQTRLGKAHIAMIGAGGLGAAALPYLAAAGIGTLTIIDGDTVERSNLHRQTIYKDHETGQSKAECAASYCRALNPDIDVIAMNDVLNTKNAATLLEEKKYDMLLDGSDNFETKTLLNALSIETEVPLISASVNQWNGQIGIFAGYADSKPCYHCLFPELPNDTRNCNEAGILGTTAGMTGMIQGHLALCALLGLQSAEPGTILTFDFKTFRMQNLTLSKNKNCPHCGDASAHWIPIKQETTMPNLYTFDDIKDKNPMIIDVRTTEEITADPLPHPSTHIELQTIPAQHNELPKDRLLAFICAGNIRSAQAAEYLQSIGYENICVLDKFSL